MRTLLCVGLAFVAITTNAALLLAPTNPPAGVTVVWDPSPDLSVVGYKVYYGVGTVAYTNVVDTKSALTCTIINLARGVTYYIAATAYTANGLESGFSNEVKYRPDPIPEPPSGARATNANLQVSVEIGTTPKGPWRQFANLFTATEQPGFYRSVVSIDPPSPADLLPVAKAAKRKLSSNPPPKPN